jgi:RimJ/RimL family protein N-acetyltransferase
MPSQSARPSKKALWFHCGRYFARTIKREDASESWANWLSDTSMAHVLNTPAVKLQKSDIVQYIKTFDQRSRLLLGIFERRTRVHVGIIRVDIDYAANEALVNAIIGEAAHRNRGATVAVFVPILDYLFDAAGLDKVKASILLRNQVTIRFLLKLGWQMELVNSQVKSKSDGTMLDMCAISYTREAYRAYRQTKVGQRILKRLGAAAAT